MEELSVQQLIDCDIPYNHGCNGGDPFLCFNGYAKSNPVVDWDKFTPYSNKTNFNTTNCTKVNQTGGVLVTKAESPKLPLSNP